MSALTWKYVIWILALDVLLIYSLQPESPLYALFLSVLLWKIVIHDASMDKIEAKMLLLLFIIGALLHERDVFFYLWQCSFSAAVFCGSYKLCTREQIGQQESYLCYDIIGVMLVLLYDLLVLQLPQPLYQMIFHPFDGALVWAFCGGGVALAAVIFCLRKHIATSIGHSVFYAILFGICNPFVSLISMLIGSLIHYGKTRFRHSPYIRWSTKKP